MLISQAPRFSAHVPNGGIHNHPSNFEDRNRQTTTAGLNAPPATLAAMLLGRIHQANNLAVAGSNLVPSTRLCRYLGVPGAGSAVSVGEQVAAAIAACGFAARIQLTDRQARLHRTADDPRMGGVRWAAAVPRI